MKKINWKVLILSFIAVFVVAAIGSSVTTIGAWYESIKPSITPPNFVFPIAWTTLFILIAISLYFAWTSSNKKEKKNIAVVYGANFVLNITWSALFFSLQNTKAAFVDIIFLWFSIVAMIIVAWKADKRASLMLVPYLAWVSFATLLNFLAI
ncbi:MAG: TspO/MBR family protein [Candidatus Aenigmatarchaeota archaeon]